MKTSALVTRALKRGHGRPVSVQALLEDLADEGITRLQLETALDTLVRAGSAFAVGPDEYVALRERNLVVGKLSVNRRGYGFVSMQGGDVYVGSRDLNGAMNGDIVAVRVSPRRGRLGKSGEVAYVLERANKSIVGRYERQGRVGLVVPTDPRLQGDVFIDVRHDMEAQPNDIVVARITRYPSDGHAAQGVIEEVLGQPDAPGVDVEIVIREHALRVTFPEEVMREAETIPESVPPAEPGRRDLRDVFTVTIDPKDARDFDDAISVQHIDGRTVLGVHIADVSHYVPWGSPIDQEARLRGTSVYLVDRVLPMLPERLSNGTCSLKPGVDRFAMSVMMTLTKDGAVEDYELFSSVIRSDRRLSYDEVDEWLSALGGFPDEPTELLLRDFRRLAESIQKRRVSRGGLDFETVEPKVWLDPEGRPQHVTLRQRTVATNMIEEAMILANEVVSRHMVRSEAPMVFRIHEDPDSDALDEVAVILTEFDYPIKEIRGASPQTFQKIVKFAHDRPEKLLINSLLLRALKRARYTDALGPHFGLASEAYTHFTSPIRRYPDLMVHRLLKAQLARSLDEPPTAAMIPELPWLVEHSSATEREAEAAEDDSVKVKLVELMAGEIGEEFPGVITGVTTFGMFVQLENTAEGLVHVESLKDDYYRLDAERFMIWGEHTGREYRLGERVDVRVVNVVVAERRIDFELVGDVRRKPQREPRRSGKPRAERRGTPRGRGGGGRR